MCIRDRDEVGVLKRHRVGERFDDGDERVRIGHGLVDLVQVRQRMRGVGFADDYGDVYKRQRQICSSLTGTA